MKKKTAIMFSTAVITTLLSFNPPVQAASDPEIRATEYNMDVRLNPHKNQLTEKVNSGSLLELKVTRKCRLCLFTTPKSKV